MIYLCLDYVLHLRFIYDLRFLWFCIYVFFYVFFMVVFYVFFFNGLVHAAFMFFFFYDFPLPA